MLITNKRLHGKGILSLKKLVCSVSTSLYNEDSKIIGKCFGVRGLDKHFVKDKHSVPLSLCRPLT